MRDETGNHLHPLIFIDGIKVEVFSQSGKIDFYLSLSRFLKAFWMNVKKKMFTNDLRIAVYFKKAGKWKFVSGSLAPAENRFGGVHWLGVGVTDLERSRSFYERHLEFDCVVLENHYAFSGLVDEVSGGTGTVVRSCLLANSSGNGMIELFEVVNPRGRSIPFGVKWGDFGYLQVCLSGVDVRNMTAYCEAEGLELLAPAQAIGDPEHGGAFMYLRDPDGIPVEYVAFS